MTRRNWKRARPNSLTAALRLCKEYAQERKNLSVEGIADRMGVSHDVLYKWLGSGRMPAMLLPAYEVVCGAHFASAWLASCAGKLVIDMPAGRTATPADMVALNSGFAQALQLLTDFYSQPGRTDPADTLAALHQHLQQVAWHHANVSNHATPELEFE